MSGWLIAGSVGAGAAALIGLWRFSRSRPLVPADARRQFQQQREHLEADFFQAAAVRHVQFNFSYFFSFFPLTFRALSLSLLFSWWFSARVARPLAPISDEWLHLVQFKRSRAWRGIAGPHLAHRRGS